MSANLKKNLSSKELAVLRRLSTPIKIQDFLDSLPINYEKRGETYMSPREVIREKKAHCFEGALLAAAALWLHGEKPLLLDLKTVDSDVDHVVALYRKNGYWGAISKTNHAVLRFRDPVYKTIRELAASYFHEYFEDKKGLKTLRSYSRPFDLRRIGSDWIAADTAAHSLYPLVVAIDESRHFPLFPKRNIKFLRKAGKLEMKAGKLIEWKRSSRFT